MGMTDNQYKSLRREQLEDYEDMLLIAKETNADQRLVEKLEKSVAKAKADVEA